MFTRLQSTFIALGFLGALVASLSLDLHGAVAVACALGFILFASASMAGMRRLGRLKRIFGGTILTLTIASYIFRPQQNWVFIATLVAVGALLLVDPLVLWLTKPRELSSAS